MSWDISLAINTGTEERAVVYIGNYTYNVAPMYKRAIGCTLSDLDERNAGEVVDLLADGVEAMEANPAEYREWNPPNGWGDYEGALRYLRRLAEACKNNPDCIIWVR